MADEFDIYRDVLKFVDNRLHRELRDQGHYNTGALENSIYGRIYNVPGGHSLKGFALYYGEILEDGVRPDRIPFSITGNGGTSKYIQGLITYFRSKGLKFSEAKSAAFATAMKHKKEGMPSEGSQRYSKTGFRTSFISIVDKAISREVDRRIMKGVDDLVNKKFHTIKSETI